MPPPAATPTEPLEEPRRKYVRHSKAVNPAHVSQRERRRLALLEPDYGERRLPSTRGECVDGARPCPFVSCRHHLYLDVKKSGSIVFNFPNRELEELPQTCSLDAADLGGLSLEEAGSLFNLTKERMRQLEILALARLEVGVKGHKL